METEPQLDSLIEAAASRIHYARQQAWLEGGYGDALKGAREFIRVVVAEMAAMPAGAPRNHLWKAVVLDAERMVLSTAKQLSDVQKGLLGQELRLKTQLAISKDLVVEQLTRKKAGRPKGTMLDVAKLKEIRGKLSQEEFSGRCGVDLSTIKRAENGDSLDGATIDKIGKGVLRLTGKTIDLRKVQKGQK